MRIAPPWRRTFDRGARSSRDYRAASWATWKEGNGGVAGVSPAEGVGRDSEAARTQGEASPLPCPIAIGIGLFVGYRSYMERTATKSRKAIGYMTMFGAGTFAMWGAAILIEDYMIFMLVFFLVILPITDRLTRAVSGFSCNELLGFGSNDSAQRRRSADEVS